MTSGFALKTPLWIAFSIYGLVAIVKKKLGLKQCRSEILQISSLTLFENTPDFQALSQRKRQNPGALRFYMIVTLLLPGHSRSCGR